MDKELLDRLLLSETETEILEFKEAKQSYSINDLGKYFSTLGNEANLKNKAEAYLLFGVNNAQEIIGTKISDKQLNKYKEEISKNISPKMSFIDVQRFETNKGAVIIFKIPPAPRGVPFSWKGHRYGRDGESLGGLNDYELNQILSQTKDWSSVIVEEASIEDLDKEAIVFARVQYKLKNPKLTDEIETWDDSKFLDKSKITIKGKITRTALLLLGKSESEHFLNPSVARITWILKDKDNIEKDYEHFYCPFILNVEKVRKKIRILKYRYMLSGTLFPEEVDQYDPYLIRESLHNCIAHQDYTLGGKIVIVENEDAHLSFSNDGAFIPSSIEDVIIQDTPESIYRNPFLVQAMVNLNMIDTIGSGIKKMFNIQRRKFFPLPDYDLSNNKVKVTFYGKVKNDAYARKLAEIPELSLHEVLLLDKVAKEILISTEEASSLRKKNLIEGRRPNYHISSSVAAMTGEKASYIKNKGFDDSYYESLIIEYLKEFKSARSADFKKLLNDKFPDILNEQQKENKLRNMLQAMKRKNIIYVTKARDWSLV